MDFTDRTCSKEGEDGEIGWQGYGYCFLGFAWNNLHRLSSAEALFAGDYYANVLDCFNNVLKEKRPHLAKKKVLFHQDNARVHTAPAPIVKFAEFRYELLPHPAYSPDLAPSDCFLIPNLKKWLGGERFETREELITETEAFI